MKVYFEVNGDLCEAFTRSTPFLLPFVPFGTACRTPGGRKSQNDCNYI
jgi:hypothetical protein